MKRNLRRLARLADLKSRLYKAELIEMGQIEERRSAAASRIDDIAEITGRETHSFECFADLLGGTFAAAARELKASQEEGETIREHCLQAFAEAEAAHQRLRDLRSEAERRELSAFLDELTNLLVHPSHEDDS